jgi:DNA-binding protein Fis
MRTMTRPMQLQTLQVQDLVGRFLTLEEICEQYVDYVLERCDGNRQFAAEALGVPLTALETWLNKRSLNPKYDVDATCQQESRSRSTPALLL